MDPKSRGMGLCMGEPYDPDDTDALFFEGAETNSTAVASKQFELFSSDGNLKQWTVPDGVTSISIAAVGAGGGADFPPAGQLTGNASSYKRGSGGSGVRWSNNISVTPGEVLDVRCGFPGVPRNSGYSQHPPEFDYGANTWNDKTRCSQVRRQNGTVLLRSDSPTGGSQTGCNSGTGNGGGNGGSGGGDSVGQNLMVGAGGGAGGYSGTGGTGGNCAANHNTGSTTHTVGTAGTGSSAGGGGGTNTLWNQTDGGDIYLWGAGDPGATSNLNANGNPGSQTGTGSTNPPQFCAGGGGGANGEYTWGNQNPGSHGAVRITWPGNTKQFPSTNVEYPL